jgi:hypothetical protein
MTLVLSKPSLMRKLHIVLRKQYAELALGGARAGDWRFLADHLEGRGLVSAEIRAFLVAVLRQEVRRPNNRVQTSEKNWEQLERAELVWETEQKIGREAAIDEAATGLGVNRRTIQRALKEFECEQELPHQQREAVEQIGRVTDRMERGEIFFQYTRSTLRH